MNTTTSKHPESFVAARNACKMCTPLGACLAFSGVEGMLPLLHGSQGCSTYIRRYLISHFREPLDIASSNFSEQSAIFGGSENLKTALKNVSKSYTPSCIGVCTTCLSETIGDNVKAIVGEFSSEAGEDAPRVIHVSTPSYAGSHFDGFIAAIRAIVEQVAQGGVCDPNLINIIPGMVSPADLRFLRDLATDFGLRCNLLPDYSERLDGGAWSEYQKIPPGGTSLQSIRSMGTAIGTLELTTVAQADKTAGRAIEMKYAVRRFAMGLPIGIEANDELCKTLETLSGRETPKKYAEERSRLIDAYVDGHKYVSEKRVLIFGEEDLVIAMAKFAMEIGLVPALCATGGTSGKLDSIIHAFAPECKVIGDVDFEDIADVAKELEIDLLIGNSKGYKLSKSLKRPIIRVGMPIHDRLGAARVRHLGYVGAQMLYDQIVNAILEHSQNSSDIGYSYI
jgi:nitrogenase molybdenum-iron protein NifN